MPNPNMGGKTRFKKGHKYNAGFPFFSLRTAIKRFGDEKETIRDDGTVLTRADLAAAWIWEVIITGHDAAKHPDTGQRDVARVDFRGRLQAVQYVRDSVEPQGSYDQHMETEAEAFDSAESADMEAITTMTDGELAQLQGLLTKAAATQV